jgi:tetratricopeptide (TPR) repeat protein
MSEEIINALSQLEGLRVAARSSSFAFKNKLVDITDVGAKLNVDAVLEGSVRKAGNKLRITAQLINIADGYHLWSERYDRDMGDIFSIQDEIATTIVERLKVILVQKDEPLVKPPTQNLDAYQLYLRGRFFWNRRELQPALECFENAVSLDPDFALAHTGVADANAILGFGYGGDPRVVAPKGKKAAQRALELDDTLAEAHYSLAYFKFVYERDWPAAAGAFRKAIALNPKHVAAHYMYGFYLLLVEDRGDEGIEEARQAVAIDPLDSHATGMLCLILWLERRSREAIRLLETAIEREPTYFFLHRCLGLAYTAESNYPQAVAALEQAAVLSRRDVVVLMELAWVQVLSGNTGEADAILEELLARSEQQYVNPSCMAFIQGAMGRNEEALALFDRAYDEGDPVLVATRIWQRVLDSPLTKDPGWDVLLRRIGWE